MPRPLWSGAISFGLLNIPVSLVSAKEGEAISFSLLDKRDHSRIGYKQYNKKTGKEVNKRDIVKGYEYEPEHFVVITDKDFERANPKATRSIEIEDFVNLDDVDPLLFERPYYLLPAKNGEKSYMLLKKVLARAKKVAIGQIVLHRKQRLVSIMARGDYLVCEVLRYPREILAVDEFKSIEKVKDVSVSKRELDMAEKLVEGMTAKWDPDKYKDTYHDDVMKRIKAKIRSGGAIESEEPEQEERAPASRVLDLMPLLKKSLAARTGEAKKSRSRKRTSHSRRA